MISRTRPRWPLWGSMGTMCVALAAGGPLVGQEESRSDRCVCDGSGSVVWDGPELRYFSRMGDRSAEMGVSLSADPEGARVVNVREGSPAEEAGLREGDLIVQVDGRDLLEPLDARRERRFRDDESVATDRLLSLAQDWEPGDLVEVVYLREGREETVEVEVERSEGFAQVLGNARRLAEVASTWGDGLRFERTPGGARVFGMPGQMSFGTSFSFFRGLELRELDPELGRYFGVDEGVLVLSVDEEDTTGLQAGDVVVGIGGREVDEPSDVYRILGSYDRGETILWELVRDGELQSLERERR